MNARGLCKARNADWSWEAGCAHGTESTGCTAKMDVGLAVMYNLHIHACVVWDAGPCLQLQSTLMTRTVTIYVNTAIHENYTFTAT